MNTQTYMQKLELLAERSISSYSYIHSLLEELKPLLPFAGACCTNIDPYRLLSTGAVVAHNMESIHHQLLTYAYGQEGIHSYDNMTLSHTSVMTLHCATEGQPEQSSRYQDILQPAGFGDELRAALLYKGSCWGYLTLFRKQDQSLFSEQECQWMVEIAPIIAKHLRQFSLAIPFVNEVKLRSPEILMLSQQLELLSSNSDTHHWLDVLRQHEGITTSALPRSILTVASMALTDDTIFDQRLHTDCCSSSLPCSPIQVCVPVREHDYIDITAYALYSHTSSIQLMIAIQSASPLDILPSMMEDYHLSEREKQIVDQVIEGLSTRKIADILHLSPCAVEEHLQSIFAKTKTTSRRELIARLLSQTDCIISR
ncbi:helix-turn-helix transcriptional regulator [Paenibacillus sp. CFBP13512]|uniref:helix-turn-helix transcriptional regulator n=1 Tax=Paenibacillus sp. CFBP13512 TaxID=2184007 RepID=UPI0010C0CB4F|nr:helix-turn-helix transcriptional regulator [Paenibacillus sp. CFBP13512]TKJ84843.1 helix-turn-helix transcriptional regulator [Paenibacillus sp. CFBP13512]